MRLSRQIQITIYTWLALGYQALGKPAWVSDFTARQTGKAYETICEGQGPSRDLARSEALASCKGAAIRQLKTTVNFKSLSIETEHDTSYHAEVEETGTYSGLVCDPKREATEEIDGSVRLWLHCVFDLSKVSPGPDKADIVEVKPQSSAKVDATFLKPMVVTPGSTASSSQRRLIIASAPKCNEILIQGKRSRVVRCEHNPVTIFVDENDEILIVRAKGLLPKKVDIKQLSGETLNVVLDAQ